MSEFLAIRFYTFVLRFPYQNIDLYNGAEVADLDVEANLKYM